MENQQLSCMDVWGGNQATFSAFEKSGLDIWLYSRPYGTHANGGDVYYLSSCASGRITRMFLADVAGHGESVSHIATQLRSLFRRYINSIQPKKLFEEVNADFAKMRTDDRFATSIMSSYFSPTSTLSICNAGHPPPLLLQSGGSRWEPIDAENRSGGLPLGIVDAYTFMQFDIPVRVGDLVLCYTDGLIESTDSDGRQLGVSGLQQILQSLPADQPEQILPGLVERLAKQSGGVSHDDDLTMLLFRITDRPISLRDNLAAPFRWLKSIFTGRESA